MDFSARHIDSDGYGLNAQRKRAPCRHGRLRGLGAGRHRAPRLGRNAPVSDGLHAWQQYSRWSGDCDLGVFNHYRIREAVAPPLVVAAEDHEHIDESHNRDCKRDVSFERRPQRAWLMSGGVNSLDAHDFFA